jgi:hypothetical protein
MFCWEAVEAGTSALGHASRCGATAEFLELRFLREISIPAKAQFGAWLSLHPRQATRSRCVSPIGGKPSGSPGCLRPVAAPMSAKSSPSCTPASRSAPRRRSRSPKTTSSNGRPGTERRVRPPAHKAPASQGDPRPLECFRNRGSHAVGRLIPKPPLRHSRRVKDNAPHPFWRHDRDLRRFGDNPLYIFGSGGGSARCSQTAISPGPRLAQA